MPSLASWADPWAYGCGVHHRYCVSERRPESSQGWKAAARMTLRSAFSYVTQVLFLFARSIPNSASISACSAAVGLGIGPRSRRSLPSARRRLFVSASFRAVLLRRFRMLLGLAFFCPRTHLMKRDLCRRSEAGLIPVGGAKIEIHWVV